MGVEILERRQKHRRPGWQVHLVRDARRPRRTGRN